jgi:hypothetical protein
MALPSFSFGAEGVEYGRAASYYATTAGNEVFPDDVEVQGNLTVEGSTTLRATNVNGTLTVTQPATGGTRTAYLTNGGVGAAEKSVSVFNDQSATLVVMKNNGNTGDIGLDAEVTGGRFTLTKPVNIPALGGASSGNLNVGGAALVAGNLNVGGSETVGANLLVTSGIYGASLTTPPSFPIGFTSGVPLPLPGVLYNQVSVTDSTIQDVTTNVVRLNMVVSSFNIGGINTFGAQIRNPSWTTTDVFMVSPIILPTYSVGVGGAFGVVPLAFTTSCDTAGILQVRASCPASEVANFAGTIRCWIMRYAGSNV